METQQQQNGELRCCSRMSFVFSWLFEYGNTSLLCMSCIVILIESLLFHSILDGLDLSKLVQDALSNSRRKSLECEKTEDLPTIVKEGDQALLGNYLKFVNREESITELLKHAADQYKVYLSHGTTTNYQSQFAACSGGPGLGKTTFAARHSQELRTLKSFGRACPTVTRSIQWSKRVSNTVDNIGLVWSPRFIFGKRSKSSFHESRLSSHQNYSNRRNGRRYAPLPE